MNRLLSALVLIVLVCYPSSAAEPTLLVPAATWEPIFFNSINTVASRNKLQDLRHQLLPSGDLEFRVWVGFGKAPLRAYIMKRMRGKWEAFVLEPRKPGPQNVNWDLVWKKLLKAGLFKIRDDSRIEKKIMVADGTSYVVEVNRDGKYQTFMVANPQALKSVDGSRMLGVISILNEAYGR